MLELVFELIELRFVQFLKNLQKESNPFEGFLIVIPHPFLYLAIKKYGAGVLPNGTKFLEKGDDELLLESDLPFIITNDVCVESILRKKVLVSDINEFVQPIQRCISQILAHFKAEHFVDVFDASVVASLKSILQKDGVFHMLRAVVHIIKLSQEGKPLEPAQQFEKNFRKSVLANQPERKKDYSSLLEFFDNLSRSAEPHTYIKAYLSYYIYIKSNKNISHASRILKISRTTLHDHLRIATELAISDQIAELEDYFASSRGPNQREN